ncbi:MAG: hypothetical protein OSB70_15305 [Myxococcota bacterium]|nr:hypothetical protein [Myxococcota bacterium]
MRATFVFPVVTIFVLLGAVAGSLPVASAEPPSESMKSLDALFTVDYSIAQKAMLERVKETGLIVVNGPNLLLYLNGEKIAEAKVGTPPAYRNLKTNSHIPLAAFVLLVPEADSGDLSPATRLRVKKFIGALELMVSSITPGRFPGPGSVNRQDSMVQSSLEFLAKALEAGRIDKEGLFRFARSQQPDLTENLSAAADAQLRSLDETIRRWRSDELTPAQWDSVRVVILGAATAHRRELHLQYFSAVMGVPMQGTDRLMYYEGFDLDGAFELVGRFRLDGEASEAFFEDPSSLFSDILADTTREWLAIHAERLGPGPEKALESGSDNQ